MWLICGLGNPGKKYLYTRHNIGFDILDSLVKKYSLNLIKKDKLKEIYKGNINSIECILCKPLVFVNQSGMIVKKISKFYQIPNKNILMIHDDLDLKLSKVKVKIGGGNGGHNGLLDTDKNIGKDYKRLRFGIDHPGNKKLVSSYVLKKFSKEDREIVNQIIELISIHFPLIFDNESLFLTKISSKMK